MCKCANKMQGCANVPITLFISTLFIYTLFIPVLIHFIY